MNTILVTGVTGNIGSHVLFELLFDLYSKNEKAQIYVLIRKQKNISAKQRLWSEVFTEQLIPEKIVPFYKEYVKEYVKIIEGEIHNFTIPKEAGNSLIVYHLAASVNLSNTEKARNEIANINYNNTQAFFEAIKLRTKKLVFVSTAFSRGEIAGKITDDYHSVVNFDFRNFYEAYKMKVEKLILEIAKENNFSCTIARPSVVSGRLIDMPKYVSSRYIVFYSIGEFFKKMKETYPEMGKIRMALNMEGGLNIVPVDYVAKGIIKASDSTEEQLNITLTKNVPTRYIIHSILNKCGVEMELVPDEPENKTTMEKIFYKTIGSQLLKYSTSKKHHFESKLIRKLLCDIEEPDMEAHFKKVYDFAHDINFNNANITLEPNL
ncbi:NAD-dependent epimerase/dehydratase family protein [Aquimarina sp. BL5]|uniref:SDR family oxidoreductase n=1 Tax=Aquimarina sp. BL5 TaxID=1714860 RepID=UPI000E52AAA7|nr:SDR family oxidoreductase [Aquimarina sp. BL5]AXT53200.1 NAD-dependent epimerase/dehydratase family protein [Aquimarina sp. BL5]RKN02878.1 NAD-dependent epimerase/dehydratase family protein [Aquimarina sp. BL5]